MERRGRWREAVEKAHKPTLCERFEALEGSAAGRPYLVRFPSYAAARACFYSAGYQQAIAFRAETASFDIVVVEGMPA